MLKMSVVKSLIKHDSILKSTVKVEISLVFYKDYYTLNVCNICHGAIIPLGMKRHWNKYNL